MCLRSRLGKIVIGDIRRTVLSVGMPSQLASLMPRINATMMKCSVVVCRVCACIGEWSMHKALPSCVVGFVCVCVVVRVFTHRKIHAKCVQHQNTSRDSNVGRSSASTVVIWLGLGEELFSLHTPLPFTPSMLFHCFVMPRTHTLNSILSIFSRFWFVYSCRNVVALLSLLTLRDGIRVHVCCFRAHAFGFSCVFVYAFCLPRKTKCEYMWIIVR